MKLPTPCGALGSAVLVCASLSVWGRCYFPLEYQGVFVAQLSREPKSSQVRYSEITVLPDAVPNWGVCESKVGNRVILYDRVDDGVDCLRCFHFRLRSRNILEVHNEGLSVCYATEEEATASCLEDEELTSGSSKQILLFKTRVFSESGEADVVPEYCSINRRYHFSYATRAGGGDVVACNHSTSQITNCPHGYGLSFHFRSCALQSRDIAFHCLGDWEGSSGERFMALLDTHGGIDLRPRYRCARYSRDELTQKIHLAFSSDSTCTSDLVSSREGHEVFELSPVPETLWPEDVTSTACMFPWWLTGQWKDISVENDSIVYHDQTTFKTVSAKCVENAFESPPNKFLIYCRSDCGQEYYTCIQMVKRDTNVMEYKLGTSVSKEFDAELCDPGNFGQKSWVTQGRVKRSRDFPCPISGEFTGSLPDEPGLCAKLTSDCRQPQTMFHVVYSCRNTSEVYEEREYRCLGHWEEDGVLYAYSERTDVLTFECFVGVISADRHQLHIQEAGKDCRRNNDPLNKGMVLRRQAFLEDSGASSSSSPLLLMPQAAWVLCAAARRALR